LNACAKWLTLETLEPWRQSVRERGLKLVVTNGCFDLLHLGHVRYLQTARREGDLLLVGVNGDASVRALKGPTRPLHSESERAEVLAALECVSAVCIFQETRATRFLERVQPDVYVKGGDYTLETLDADERRVVQGCGGRIVLVPFVDGHSTTGLLRRMAASEKPA
jgi:rfaE bifunctional protein nucleotidyltransferase chain/domain